MLYQTWLAHPSIRIPGVMILDPLNWDNVPEALDYVRKVEGEKLPW